MSHNIAPSIGNRWYPQGHVAGSESPCKRGCCWSPYGHSSAARDCRCHDKQVQIQVKGSSDE